MLPAFPSDAAAASLSAEQVAALRASSYVRQDSGASAYGRQDAGAGFYGYSIGDGDESPASTATGYMSPRTPITLTPIITPSSPVPPGQTPTYLRGAGASRGLAPRLGGRRRRQLTSQNGSTTLHSARQDRNSPSPASLPKVLFSTTQRDKTECIIPPCKYDDANNYYGSRRWHDCRRGS